MSSPDRLAVLASLRPGTAEDQGWDPRARDVARARILASDPVATAYDARPAARPGRARRRHGVSLAIAGALVVAGGGAAVASGRLPDAFTQAFAGWTGDWSENGVAGADPDTAERVATAAGPDGTVFTVMAAPARAVDDPDGAASGACTVVVLETAASAREPGPVDFQDVSGNGCQSSLAGTPFSTMRGVDVAYAADSRLGVTQDVYVWSASSGDAATAEVVTADGRRWPSVVHDGTLYGWFPALVEGEARPELVGYSADGTEVARAEL